MTRATSTPPHPPDPAKAGTGKGRKSSQAYLLRQQGRFEEADAVAAPSEKKLTEAQKCGARTQNGTFCGNRKGSRTDHPGYGTCAKHGGNTSAGVKSAMREMGRDLAAKFKEERRFGGDRRDPSLATLSPEQALLEEVRRTAAFVRFLEERIARWNLSPEIDLVIEDYVSSDKNNFRAHARGDAPTLGRHLDALLNDVEEAMDLPALTERHQSTGIVSFTDAREWLYLYREERGHLARVAKMCIDAGVAQRMVSLAENQGRMMASAIRAVLNALNLSPQQASLVPVIVPPVLRAVASDQPIPDVTHLALEAAKA